MKYIKILLILGGALFSCFSCSPNTVVVGINAYTGSLGSTYLGPGQGTRFAVYAPHASAVSVVGVFNSFDSSAHPMSRTPSGVWETTISAAQPGHAYKYYSTDFNGEWVTDPYGRSFNGSDNDNALIIDNTYTWNDGAWNRPGRKQLIIYEMHVKDFTRGDSDASSATYQGVIDKIPYLSGLGINAVELMPVQDWAGIGYSWGYNSACYFAPENSLSDNNTDGQAVQDFKELVDALHQAGIAVILDVVYNHTFQDSPLWKIDPSAYYDTGTSVPWGEKLDLTKAPTLRYVNDNLRYWMDEFHVDGFRFDSTENIDSPALLNVISGLRADGYNSQYYIFEEFDGSHNNAIQNYNSSSGSQYISSWGTGYKNAVWSLIDSGASSSMAKVTYYSRDDNWNYPAEVINYFSSHDEGTLTGNVAATVPEVKTAAVHLLTSLGIPMLWMGEEVLNPHYGNHPPSGDGTDEANNIVAWDSLRSVNASVYSFFSSLIKLRKAHPALYQNVNDPISAGSTFAWNTDTDWNDGFLGYTYKGVSGDNDFIILVNYESSPRPFNVSFPGTGTWYLMCNGTTATNLAPGLETWTIVGMSSNITTPAKSALIFMSAAVN